MKSLTSETLKIYWQHTKKRKWQAVEFVACVLIASVGELIPPLYYAQFFDVLSSSETRNIDSLVHILFIIIAIHISVWFFYRASELLNNIYKNYIMVDLSQTAFSSLHSHSIAFFSNSFVGSLVKKVKQYISSYDRMAGILTWNLIPLVSTIVIIFSVLAYKNIWFGAGVLLFAITMTIFNYYFSIYKLRYDEMRTKASTTWTGHLADTITNQINVKIFNGRKREQHTFWKKDEEVRRLNTITWNLGDMGEGFQVLFIIILEFGLMYGALILWQKGTLRIGDFVLIQAYVLKLVHNFWGIGRIMRDFYESLADANEMTEILTTPHDIVDTKSSKSLVVTKGKIIFDKVSFQYHKTRNVIKNIDLVVKSGERVGLVGPSGAGKSTITKLLLRLHDVSKGKITIDGQRIDRVTQESLWKHVSLVPQDPVLFHRTLIENIRYGRPDATDEEVKKAAKLAYCDKFIEDLPYQYETYVGERGVKLSGGERQRVAIARAILKNSPILVLDEATSSLDSESENLIQEALNNLMKQKTVIVIAHRLSTIMKMDRIIVLENGKIKEQGSHSKLLNKKTGIYKKLWEFQVGGFIE